MQSWSTDARMVMSIAWRMPELSLEQPTATWRRLE